MPGEQTRLIYPKYNDSQYSHNIISQIWFLVNNPLETLKEYSDTEIYRFHQQVTALSKSF